MDQCERSASPFKLTPGVASRREPNKQLGVFVMWLLQEPHQLTIHLPTGGSTCSDLETFGQNQGKLASYCTCIWRFQKVTQFDIVNHCHSPQTSASESLSIFCFTSAWYICVLPLTFHSIGVIRHPCVKHEPGRSPVWANARFRSSDTNGLHTLVAASLPLRQSGVRHIYVSRKTSGKGKESINRQGRRSDFQAGIR